MAETASRQFFQNCCLHATRRPQATNRTPCGLTAGEGFERANAVTSVVDAMAMSAFHLGGDSLASALPRIVLLSSGFEFNVGAKRQGVGPWPGCSSLRSFGARLWH